MKTLQPSSAQTIPLVFALDAVEVAAGTFFMTAQCREALKDELASKLSALNSMYFSSRTNVSRETKLGQNFLSDRSVWGGGVISKMLTAAPRSPNIPYHLDEELGSSTAAAFCPQYGVILEVDVWKLESGEPTFNRRNS